MQRRFVMTGIPSERHRETARKRLLAPCSCSGRAKKGFAKFVRNGVIEAVWTQIPQDEVLVGTSTGELERL